MIEYIAKQSGILADEARGLTHHAAVDIDPLCQRVLCAHQGPHAPQHVFGDLAEMIPSRDLVALETDLSRRLSLVQTAVSGASSADELRDLRRAAVEQHSREFLDGAMEKSRKWEFSSSDRFWCVKCSAHCRRWPAQITRKYCTYFEIGGSVCVGHSNLGTGWGWLHKSAISCIVWACAMRRIKPTAVLHECVPGFDPAVLSDLLGPDFFVESLVFSPVDCGVPTERTRRYSIAFLKESTFPGRIPYTLDNFSVLAFRRLVVDGNIFFTMPADLVDHAMMHASHVGLACASISNSDCTHFLGDATWLECLTKAEKMRLDQYRTLLQADFNGRGNQVC